MSDKILFFKIMCVQCSLIKFVNVWFAIVGYAMPHGPIQVFVKPDVPKDLLSLMEEYANMLEEINSADLPSTNFDRLKGFLSFYCREKLIRKFTSLCDVIDFLVDKMKIYIFNIDTLIACSKHFDSAKVKGSIQQYRQQLNEFLSGTTIQEFKGTLQTKIIDRSVVESIILKLDESRTEDTLDALEKLVKHFFGNALLLSDVRPGCVSIIWLASSSLLPALRTAAEQHSHNYLASQGVLEIVIGLRIAPIEGLHCLILAVLILIL